MSKIITQKVDLEYIDATLRETIWADGSGEGIGIFRWPVLVPAGYRPLTVTESSVTCEFGTSPIRNEPGIYTGATYYPEDDRATVSWVFIDAPNGTTVNGSFVVAFFRI